jgi:uncharacterized protein (TIGR02117 family)
MALVLAPAAAWLFAAESLSRIPTGAGYERGLIPVFLISNGWHADLAMPARAAGIDWPRYLPPEDFQAADPMAAYIAFGWGDRDFYLETPRFSDLSAGTALKAVMGSGRAVLHVSYLHQPEAGPGTSALFISEAAYVRLALAIRQQFQSDGTGKSIVIPGQGYGAADAFYEAKGSYSLVRTCNAWMGERLIEADLPSGRWAPLARHLLAAWSKG